MRGPKLTRPLRNSGGSSEAVQRTPTNQKHDWRVHNALWSMLKETNASKHCSSLDWRSLVRRCPSPPRHTTI